MFDDNIWITAIYLRLSDEDRLKSKENYSFSILNQKEQIKNFVYEDGNIIIYDYYIDDGYSGTNFDRPEFKRMIQDIMDKKINMVIVKDLSRLGRNHIGVGNYLENIFPQYNIRFVALNENIDSYQNPDSINGLLVPFKNIVNDEYSRDISIKVKSALSAKRKNGEWVGSFAPYGYMKDPDNKHKLIIDKNTFENVKYIFTLYVGGEGCCSIANALNKSKILSPSEYRNIKLCKNNKKTYLWNSSVITSILKNQVYCGDVVQGKYKKLNYKSNKRINNSYENFDIVMDVHEPIIDRDTFNKVQEMLRQKNSVIKNPSKKRILSGYLRCYDCGIKMIYKKRTTNPKSDEDFYCYCRTFTDTSKDLCKSHRIETKKLYKLVLDGIKNKINNVLNLEKELKNINYHSNENIDNQIFNLEKEIKEIKNTKKELYENYKDSIITKDLYMLSVFKNDNKMKELISKLNVLNSKRIERKELFNFSNKSWIQEFKKNKNINELTRDVVEDLINIVYVHEDETIDITFKYENEYNNALKLLNEMKAGNNL